jgi:sulfoxide reductase heme-binding subunit YedZ
VVADNYVPIDLRDAVVPFVARYRTMWVGFGAVAFDLLVALVVTSLVRERIGRRTWRAIHWAAYAMWPIAVLHAFGTGSDIGQMWFLIPTLACLAAVAAAVLWRVQAATATVPLLTQPAAGRTRTPGSSQGRPTARTR